MKPKTLLFDLETSPNIGYVWGKYDQNVIKFEKEWELLSFAYKWLGDKKTVAVGQNTNTEEALVIRMWQLFNEADLVIAHNGIKFDIRKINVKFVEYGLTPPSPYKVVDTLRIARRHFMFNSNKLDDLGEVLKVGRKAQTGGYETWFGCMRGDKKAWNTMLKYNKQDVVLLEKVYLKLRPWMTNHPNYGDMAQTDHVCTACGSGAHLERRGTTKVRGGEKQRYQCHNIVHGDVCGKWSSEASIRKEGRLVNA